MPSLLDDILKELSDSFPGIPQSSFKSALSKKGTPAGSLIQRIQALTPAAVQAALDEGGVGVKPDQGAAFDHFNYDFSTGKQVYDKPGYGIIYKRQGSSLYELQNPNSNFPSYIQNVLDFDFKGIVQNVYPGSVIKGYFEGFTVQPNSASPTQGTAQLLIAKRQDAQFEEPILTSALDSLNRQLVMPGQADVLEAPSTISASNTTSFSTGSPIPGGIPVSQYRCVMLVISGFTSAWHVGGGGSGAPPTATLKVGEQGYFARDNSYTTGFYATSTMTLSNGVSPYIIQVGTGLTSGQLGGNAQSLEFNWKPYNFIFNISASASFGFDMSFNLAVLGMS